jgi:ankyrin repeat protein
MLIAKGADVHRRSESGGTAMMWAVYNGNIELVRIFLDEGIDVNDRDNRGTSKTSNIPSFPSYG